MTRGPSQTERTQARSSSVIVGSKSELSRSATGPSHDVRDANSSGSVVSRSTHQFGCIAASSTVLAVSAGGSEKPLRTSRSRAPATGTSTVSTSASYPAAAARRMSASPADRSFQT